MLTSMKIDSQGGHNDRKKGEYHCHESPCGAEGAAVKNLNLNTIVILGRIGQI
jgi:hypothetical protein